jgi:hypothetical protein
MVAEMDEVVVEGAIIVAQLGLCRYDASETVTVGEVDPGRLANITPVDPMIRRNNDPCIPTRSPIMDPLPPTSQRISSAVP